MPQQDRYRERLVPIEFNFNEEFLDNSIEDRLRLVLVTNGDATLQINGKTWAITAPSIISLSIDDDVKMLNKHRFAAKSFIFHPSFLNTNLDFESLKINKFSNIQEQHDRNLLNIFFKHSATFSGLLTIPSSMFLTINQWFGIIGTEISAQSDGRWTCRIRRYLLQTLYLLEDIYTAFKDNDFKMVEPSGDNTVKLALEYMHTYYHQDISLEMLCNVTNCNRTTLNNKFKEKTGHTLIGYLINHRIKIACEALGHTNLKLSEVAESCGFMYDTYFNKQFTKIMGETPTQYRDRVRKRIKSVR